MDVVPQPPVKVAGPTMSTGELRTTQYFGVMPDPLRPRLHIDRADPRARLHADLLAELDRGSRSGTLRADVAFADDVLTIRGTNRTVVYRIDRDDYEPASRTYGMQWPD